MCYNTFQRYVSFKSKMAQMKIEKKVNIKCKNYEIHYP